MLLLSILLLIASHSVHGMNAEKKIDLFELMKPQYDSHLVKEYRKNNQEVPLNFYKDTPLHTLIEQEIPRYLQKESCT